MKDIKQIIADNLVALRKERNLTQLDLANKLNYSDNTISRWERGEITPSVETLSLISEIYNIPLESLLKENVIRASKAEEKTLKIKRVATILLSLSLVWFVALIAYFYTSSFFDLDLWILFIWSCPLSCVVLLCFSGYLKSRLYNFFVLSFFVWTNILSIYLQFIQYNLHLIFIIGAPAQLALCVWTFMRPKSEILGRKKIK